MPIREMIRRIVREGNVWAVVAICAVIVSAHVVSAFALWRVADAIDRSTAQSRQNYNLLIELREAQKRFEQFHKTQGQPL
jgi:hypothetical protein